MACVNVCECEGMQGGTGEGFEVHCEVAFWVWCLVPYLARKDEFLLLDHAT